MDSTRRNKIKLNIWPVIASISEIRNSPFNYMFCLTFYDCGVHWWLEECLLLMKLLMLTSKLSRILLNLWKKKNWKWIHLQNNTKIWHWVWFPSLLQLKNWVFKGSNFRKRWVIQFHWFTLMNHIRTMYHIRTNLEPRRLLGIQRLSNILFYCHCTVRLKTFTFLQCNFWLADLR